MWTVCIFPRPCLRIKKSQENMFTYRSSRSSYMCKFQIPFCQQLIFYIIIWSLNYTYPTENAWGFAWIKRIVSVIPFTIKINNSNAATIRNEWEWQQILDDILKSQTEIFPLQTEKINLLFYKASQLCHYFLYNTQSDILKKNLFNIKVSLHATSSSSQMLWVTYVFLIILSNCHCI